LIAYLKTIELVHTSIVDCSVLEQKQLPGITCSRCNETIANILLIVWTS